MAELLGETEVTVVVVLFAFRGTFGAVGIVIRNLRHNELLIRIIGQAAR
jgi:hypothetical protein